MFKGVGESYIPDAARGLSRSRSYRKDQNGGVSKQLLKAEDIYCYLLLGTQKQLRLGPYVQAA